MPEARCIEPNYTYFIETLCPVNTYVFRPGEEIDKLFRPLLANVSKRFDISVHAFGLVPDRELMIVTLNNIESNLPGAIQQLHTDMDRYVRATTDRDSRIYGEKRYTIRRILNEQDAILAYVEVLTAAQNWGFSKDNVLFGDAISSLSMIGDCTERLYDRPECVRADANFVADYPENGPFGQISMSFPVIPFLAQFNIDRVRERIAEFVDLARDGIDEFRRQVGAGRYVEEGCDNLPAPAAPRPSDEYHAGDTYQADFPYMMLLGEEEQLRLEEQWIEERGRLSLWRTYYRTTLKLWRCGHRKLPFPVGTQKLHFLHNCIVAILL